MNLRSFDRVYGNIRRLLELEVQESAIAAFCRFYDSEIRCFLFKNFQMAPTLEEYEKILGFDRSEVRPYQYQGDYYSDEKFASLLQIKVEEVRLHKLERNKVFGFPQDFFERLLTGYAASNDWGSFKQVLALTIFGIVLFPQLEKYVDETAIGVFLAFRDAKSPINPVPAILAETYRAFTRHHEFKKNKMTCSFHVLFAWFIYHVGTNKGGGDDYLSHALGCHPKAMNSHEWIQTLEKLDGAQIHWFTLKYWKDKPSVLFRCGSFQNVPLMGTQGCINYNPSLTLRQLGYPMRDSPSEAMLFRFYLHAGIPKDVSLLRRILQSWENMVLKSEKEFRQRTTAISFTQWLGDRIKSTRSPNRKVQLLEERIPEPCIPTIEEFEEVKSALSKVEEEKKLLQDRLGKAMQDKEKLESENALKAAIIEENSKEFELGGEDKRKLQKHLLGAKKEVRKRTLEANEALVKANEWRRLYEKSLKDEKLLRNALTESKNESQMMKAEFANQMRSIKQDRDSVVEMLRDYQQALKREQGRSDSLENHVHYLEGSYIRLKKESDYWESQFAELISRLKNHEVFEELKREGLYWKDKFSKLAWLANQAVRDVPKKLKRAELEMHPFNTPDKVYEFVRYCRTLTEELMEKAKEADENKKRKKDEDSKALCIYRFP